MKQVCPGLSQNTLKPEAGFSRASHKQQRGPPPARAVWEMTREMQNYKGISNFRDTGEHSPSRLPAGQDPPALGITSASRQSCQSIRSGFPSPASAPHRRATLTISVRLRILLPRCRGDPAPLVTSTPTSCLKGEEGSPMCHHGRRHLSHRDVPLRLGGLQPARLAPRRAHPPSPSQQGSI